MLGRPEWFTRRKYGGWGIHPKTWQGWVYIAAILVPFALFQAFPYWSDELRLWVTGIWLAVLLVDVTDIMIHMKRDEREQMHEAIAERNAAWFMVLVITAGLLYHIIVNGIQGRIYVDPFMATALIGAVAVKGVSNYYLERAA